MHVTNDSQPSDADSTRRERLFRAAEAHRVPLRAILVFVGVVVATYLAAKVVYRLREVLLLLVVSGFIALLLNPIVLGLKRLAGRRGIAVALVTLLSVVAFGGLTVAFGYPLVNGITDLADDLPGYIRTAEQGKGWVGRLVTRYHVQAWVVKNAPKLAGYAKDLAHPALSLGKGAVSLVLALVTIFVLVVLLLVEGPKLRDGLLGLMSAGKAARIRRMAGEVNREVTGYMLGNITTSVIAGVVVFGTLTITGVPFAFLWALWVALVDFLPMIGGALAGIPVILFALAHSTTAGIVALIVFVIYTQVENHVLNPVIMSKTMRINPLLVLVSILVGASLGSWVAGFFGGFVAALLAIPTAGAIQVIMRELWQSTASPPAVAIPPPSAPPEQSAAAQAAAEPAAVTAKPLAGPAAGGTG